jgi:hypothetical protein
VLAVVRRASSCSSIPGVLLDMRALLSDWMAHISDIVGLDCGVTGPVDCALIVIENPAISALMSW